MRFLRLTVRLVIDEQSLVLAIHESEADDHAMHRRLALRLVRPLEGLMGEVDVDVSRQDVGIPKCRDVLALANGIRRDERAFGHRPLREVNGLLVPRRHEVKHGGWLFQRKDLLHVGLLLRRLLLLPTKRRIAEDVVKVRFRTVFAAGIGLQTRCVIGKHRPPVHLQRVGTDDVRRRLDRDAGEVASEAVGDLEVAEVIHQPERDLCDLAGELLDLKPKELRDIHLAERRDVEKAARIVLVQFFQNIHLQPPQLAVGDQEEVAAPASRIEKLQRGDSRMERFKLRFAQRPDN